MSTIATITADFRAQSAQFLSELKKIGSQSRATGKDVRAGLNDALRDLAAVASIGLFANFIRSSAEAADQAAKTADRLGIATERLQALKFAAAGAGVDVLLLEHALGEAQKRLAVAANTGQGDAADWIRRLHLSISELQQLSPDQLFARYSDAINTLNNRGEQFAATEALMGKGTRDLFNLIAGGSSGLRQAQQDIKDLGIELSRVDAKQIENANDSLARLKAVAQGFGQQVAVAVSPYIEEFARDLLDAAKDSDDLRGKIEVVTKGAYVGFQIAANAARIFRAEIATVVSVLATLIASGGNLDKVLNPVGQTITKFGNEAKEKLTALGGSILTTAGHAIDFDNILKDTGKTLTEIGRPSDSQGFFASLAEQSAKQAADAFAAVKSFDQIFADADRIVAQARVTAEQQIAAAAAKQNQPGTSEAIGESPIDKYIRDLQAQYAFSAEIQAQITQNIEDENGKRLEGLQRYADQRIQIETQVEQYIASLKQQSQNNAIGLLQALGQRSKGFALAALALEKGLAIARIIINSRAAAAKALAELGPIAGPPAAASIIAWGAVNAALVAATGLAQAANISSGGSTPGSPTNPIFTQPSGGTAGDQPAFGASGQNVTQIVISGNYGWTPEIIDDLVATLRDEITDRDLIIITPQSRQALDLIGG